MSIKTLLIAVLVVLISSIYGTKSYAAMTDTSGKYVDTTIRGWNVFVSTDLNNPSMITRAYSTLDKELAAIESTLPSSAIADLKQVPIWFEYTTRGNKILQYYFETSGALKKKEVDVRKAGSIEAQIVDYVNMPHDSLPLLKMFAYAYLQREVGPHNTDVEQTYQQAKASGIYETQVYNREFFPFSSGRDYFAILSDAYFAGKLSYPPFNREKLKQLDPKGYELIEKLWKVNG